MPADRLKIAVLGAGSAALTPALFHDALIEHRLDGIDLALFDPSEDVLYPMADLGRRMAGRHKVDATVTPHNDRLAALAGAAFVILGDLSLAPADQADDRLETDAKVCRAFAPAEPITAFGGVAGISHTLRQIALVQRLCDDVTRLAGKGAMLLNLADPLPRLCQAAHDEGVPTVGFCAASLSAYKLAWEILHDETAPELDAARERLDLSTAGLNHFSFVLDLWDHQTGEDLYPRLRDEVGAGRDAGQPLSTALLRKTGYLPATGDDRVRDFVENLSPPPPPPRRRSLWRRTPKEPARPDLSKAREQDLAAIRAAAAGQQPWDSLVARRTGERPIDLIAALAFNKRVTFPALNLVNHRQLEQLPRGVFVEAPATADASGIHTPPLKLPENTLPLLTRTATISDTLVRAARWKSMELLLEALELDPTVTDKSAAKNALEACLQAHQDALPQYT